MGRRTAAVLLVALLILPACARPRTGASVVSSGALGFLPETSIGLLVLEVRVLRGETSFGRWMQEMAASADQLPPWRDLRDRLGPEALSRVDRLGLAVVPLPSGMIGYGLVAEGRFDEAAMRRALGGEAVTVRAGDGRPDVTVAVLRGGDLALGPREVLEAIRSAAAGGRRGLAANATLMRLLEQVRPDVHLWGAFDYRSAAALKTGEGAPGMVPIPLAPAASGLIALSFEGTMSPAVEFVLRGEADGETSARSLADAARGLAALARMTAGADGSRAWIDVLDGLSIEQQGLRVTLRGRVPDPLLEMLAGQARATAAALPGAAAPDGP